jgi:hypothetical protein
MGRREPTAEQRARAAERRERFTALAGHVARMTDDERAALVARVGAIVTCEGRALSAFNSCLVLTQLPTASMVGGFWQWKDKGRSVQKGAQGLMIWIPTKGKDDADQPTEEETEGVAKRAGFIMGTVFDITQTDPSNDHERTDRHRPEAAAVGKL